MLSHITRYGRRMQTVLLYALIAAAAACFFAIPFVEKDLLKVETGYYMVSLNGQQIGIANTREDASEAFAEARQRLGSEYASMIYMSPLLEVEKAGVLFGTRMNVSELADSLYSGLLSCMLEIDSQFVYALKIDDTIVALEKKEDIVTVLDRLLEQYDTNNAFDVVLNAADSSGNYTVEVTKAEGTSADKNIISAILNGENTSTGEDGGVSYGGLVDISFDNDITVSMISRQQADIKTPDEVYAMLSETAQENKIHYVLAGDTLDSIAQQYHLSMEQLMQLNYRFTQNSVLIPGDEVTVSVDKSAVNVVTVKHETYEGEYSAAPEYQDDDTQSRGDNIIVSEGVAGVHKKNSEVTYINGIKTSEKVNQEIITTQAEPAVISVGTLSESDYIKPITGTFLSGYGSRYANGSVNMGTDWKAAEGTQVYSAAAGTVTRAGWYAGYGYCVDITHENNAMTRYAHLQKINVTVGQTVSQGDIIAASGSTGESETYALHFELWLSGRTVNPLDYVNK